MVRDDRLYAFIVARTSRSRSQIRRICVHKRWLKLSAFLVFVVLCTASYGFYGLTQHVMHMSVEQENERLRLENERQRQQLNSLNRRIEAVEDTSRRLAEMSGVATDQQTETLGEPQSEKPGGAGGPALPMDSMNAIEYRTDHIEQELRVYERVIRERAAVPSIWPIKGALESGFGGRRNPFGGEGFEFHTGQDIDALTGDAVVAAANGTVTFAGWQNGYGQVVVIDHGDGLTTRYGHLSQISANVGQAILRGTVLGLVGSTGRSTGPHLHYEVRIDDHPVDPRQYLPEN